MEKPVAQPRPQKENIEVIETDVVVIGGGVAGCLAVVGAAELGARSVVCDKGGRLEHSGSVGGGVDHFLAVLEEGPEWDTPEFLMRHVPGLLDGVVDIDVAERLIYNLKPMVHRLENIGVNFFDPEMGGDRYYRHRSFGWPGEYHINFDGTNFKPMLGRAVRRTNARVLERVMVTDLLMDDDEVMGAIAFNVRNGAVHVILARSAVIATGDANRLGKNASGHPFDSWHFPYNTGDGRAMVLRAGGKLANMEFIDGSVSPKGYSTQGLNAFMGGGAHLVNALGERFMFNYHPAGERARRTDLVHGVLSEISAGRGPIYCDCTHLPKDDLQRLVNTLGVDRPALPTFFAQKDIDLSKEPFEVFVTEVSSVRGGQILRGSGVHIDKDTASSTPGIFAAGDCSTVSMGISGACVMGHIAGQSAARYALSQPPRKSLSPRELERIRETLYQPMHRKEGLRYSTFEDEVRAIVTDYIGYRREEEVMKAGLKKLRSLRAREMEMIADDYHEVMRVNEARSIVANAEAIAVAAIERRESRSGAAHYRVDFPEPDNETGLRVIMVQQVGDEMVATSRPTNLTLPPG